MKHDLNRCVIWLTGASSGIGAELAKKISATDCTLILSSRNSDSLAAIAKLCKNKPDIMPLDVTDNEATKAVITKISEQYSRLDIVIFNAGDCIYVDIDKLDPLPFEQMIKTNFLSTVYGVCASLPLLRKAIEPHIVIMSSSVVYLGLARAEAYGASKAAARYFAQALNVHLASVKIPVSIIYPGFVKTALTDKNDFPMPFLISADKAAKYILRGIVNYKSEIRFPFALILVLRLLGALPAKIQAQLLKNMVKNK